MNNKFKIFIPILIAFFGIIINLIFIVPSIYYGCISGVCGLHIGEWHYHDALWHIAVSRVSFTSFPFIFPTATGFTLNSYNYLLGFILFFLEKVYINPFISYFFLLPLISNLTFFFALLRYVKVTKKTLRETVWIFFFSYLAGSFSYLLILYNGDYNGYSILKAFPVATSLQPSFVLSNIQFFLSISIFIFVFTDLITGKISKKTIFLHTFLIMLCIGLKIYTSMLLILIITFSSAYWILKSKNLQRLYYLLILAVASIISYYLFYLPDKSFSSGIPFALSPLAIPHVLTESQNLFYDKDFTLGRYYMLGLGKISARLIFYELISALIFVFINLGTRILFPFYFIRNKITLENFLLASTTIIGFIIPIFFIQKSGGWYNSIQFSYTSIYTSGILTALFIASILDKKKYRFFTFICIFVIVILSIPNTLFTFKFLTKEKITIKNTELKALTLLKVRQNGIVLSLPDNKNSSYVPALSAKQGYLIDDEQAALMNLPTGKMREDIDRRDCRILNKVMYIYLNNESGKEFLLCKEINEFKEVYKEEKIILYERL